MHHDIGSESDNSESLRDQQRELVETIHNKNKQISDLLRDAEVSSSNGRQVPSNDNQLIQILIKIKLYAQFKYLLQLDHVVAQFFILENSHELELPSDIKFPFPYICNFFKAKVTSE